MPLFPGAPRSLPPALLILFCLLQNQMNEMIVPVRQINGLISQIINVSDILPRCTHLYPYLCFCPPVKDCCEGVKVLRLELLEVDVGDDLVIFGIAGLNAQNLEIRLTRRSLMLRHFLLKHLIFSNVSLPFLSTVLLNKSQLEPVCCKKLTSYWFGE